MSVATKLKAVPWVLGTLVLAVSLLGANRLLHPTDSPATPPGGDGGPAGKSAPPPGGGVILLGTVGAEPADRVDVGPPAVAALTTVETVIAHEGQEVKPGDPLVQFDDKLFRAKLEQARAEHAAAEGDGKRADVAKAVHAIQLEGQRRAIAGVDEQLRIGDDALRAGREQFETILARERNFTTNQSLTEAEKDARRRENQDLRKGEATVAELRARADGERIKLRALEAQAADLTIQAEQAAHKVERLAATVKEAQAAVDALLVRAKVGGVVEQLAAAPGMTYGPATRSPVLVLVPAGTRVVRAEADAEFAYKLANKDGQPVTIIDANNFTLTYPGKVRRIGTAYLVKRGSADALTLNPPKTLECLIEVTDPAPAGKPPLRVGQPVRVSIP